MRLSTSQLETTRKRPQQTRLYLSIFEPQAIMKCRVNNPSAARGDRVIPYDGVSLGNFSSVKPNATMWIGSTDGAQDLGKIRVRSATSGQFIVSENSNIDWQDDAYLTVFYYFELWPVFPRVISDPSNPENVLFFKDYDIAYTNQNSILGTFINMGPNRAANLDPASGQAQLYYSSTGTYNLLGNSLNYNWQFEGGTPSSSSSANPGYVTYNTPGNYITSLSVSGSNGAVDTSYRTIRIHNQADPPIQKWQLTSLNGSRDEGGYSASFKVFEDIPIQEHAVVVIYGENWYGNTKQSLGGNYPNGSDIFWVGYVDRDSISYDYEHSEISFDAHSVTGMMKESSGFSISVGSVATPTKWYELLDMDGRRAIYHYLRWHTTALNISDFQFVGDDYKIQFFDSDRESMYDALYNFMRGTLWGKTVSDRQGKVWMEVSAEAYTAPTSSFPAVMEITKRDWMNTPIIEERLSEETAFIEMGGVAYSGTVTGTFSALLASAPGNAPGFHGAIETHEGLALLGQSQLNQLVGNVLANQNSLFPTIEQELGINASNLDIAPQETVSVVIAASDTVRNLAINGLYIPNNFDWTYTPQDFILLPRITFKELVDGEAGETITIPPPEDGGGFEVPGIQIPAIPPLTIPAFSIPSGTISAIVTSQIIAFQSDYAIYVRGGATYSSSRGASVIAVSFTDLLSSIQIDVAQGGLYLVNAYFNQGTFGGTPNQGWIQGNFLVQSGAQSLTTINTAFVREVAGQGFSNVWGTLNGVMSISGGASISAILTTTIDGVDGTLTAPGYMSLSVARISG
jgi:hypothetical protein